MNQFDEALKNFKGFDDDGNPVIGDETTGEFTSLDKEEYSDLAAEAKNKYGDKKFSDSFQDYQAKQITKDKQYLGKDEKGNSVFKNQAGIIERAKLSFDEGLKRQFGDKQFTKQSEGFKNQVTGENRLLSPAESTRTALSATSNLNRPNQPKQFEASKPSQPKQFQITKPTQHPVLNQPKQDNWSQNPEYFQKQAQKKIDSDYDDSGEYEEYYEEEFSEPEQSQPSMKSQLANLAKDAVKTEAKTQSKSYIKQQSQPYVSQAKSYVKGQGTDLMNKYLSQGMKDSFSGGKGIYDQGKGYYNTAQDILNFTKDPRTALMSLAKQQAQKSAQDALMQSGLAASVPGGLGSAISMAKAFSGGGSDQEKGDAAARAAAMAAYASATGGLGAVVNPETLAMVSALQSKGAEKLSNSNTGAVGNLLGKQLQVASTGTQLGSDLGSEALGLAGGVGGDFFASNSAAFKNAKESVKKLSEGDIVGGLSSLGSTGLKNILSNVYKAPTQAAKRAATAAKNAAKSVASAVKNVFCFTPDTLIIMADGSTKKIKDIKVGEEVALGGKVVAIGEALNQDIWNYNGTTVSGGHLVLEDAKWIRVKDSIKGKRLTNRTESIVIPMSNENHLILTSDYQVWRDMDEVDDTFNKTDDDIVEELNGQQKLNKLLQVKTNELKKM